MYIAEYIIFRRASTLVKCFFRVKVSSMPAESGMLPSDVICYCRGANAVTPGFECGFSSVSHSFTLSFSLSLSLSLSLFLNYSLSHSLTFSFALFDLLSSFIHFLSHSLFILHFLSPSHSLSIFIIL